MDTKQRTLIKRSFAAVVPVAAKFGSAFYERVFQLDPGLRSLFRTNMTEQAQKLMGLLGVVVSSIDMLEALTPAIHKLAHRHTGYGVTAGMYDTMGSALLDTLSAYLPAEDHAETLAAWGALYGEVVNVMLQASEVAA